MKSVILGLFTVIALYSCKLNKKIKPEFPHDFEFTETQMAEIEAESVPEIEVSKKDSSEFLKFWKLFYKRYKENATNAMIKLSLDSIYSPVFIEKENRFRQESEYISIRAFLKNPVRDKLIIAPCNFSREQSFVLYEYKYNNDINWKKVKQESVILNYRVLTETKEVKGNYEFRNLFTFLFIRSNNRIRFSGIKIYGESYPRLVNDSATRAKLYFPLYRKTQNPIKNLNALDTFTNLWYSAVLSEFKEANLHTYSGDDDIYRFTWLRSFHNPVVIRFQKHKNEYILTKKEMIDNGRYTPNEFVVNDSQYFTAAKWENWKIKLGRNNFWNMATLDHESRPMDGADWILEAKINGRYHFVTRYSYDAEFMECCKYLLRLSKLKIREEDIY